MAEAATVLPRHIAIVMDGNGRWAQQRKRPRTMGHQAGVSAVKRTVEHCVKRGVEALTLFAFSSENWQRPKQEVDRLMELFMKAMDREVDGLRKNGVRIRFIGDQSAFSTALQQGMEKTQAATAHNTRLRLNIAVNYGGRWDIVRAAQTLAQQVAEQKITVADINEALFAEQISLSDLPPLDLFIRTGGETRISNFLLWQIAYAELVFSEVLWPDFDGQALDNAIADFSGRQRRFGKTGEQVQSC